MSVGAGFGATEARSHHRGDLRWYQHGASGDLPCLQLGIDAHCFAEWESFRLGVDPAGPRHRSHLHQFDAEPHTEY